MIGSSADVLDDRGDAGWLAGAIPDSLACRALSVEVRGPDAVTVGEPARFLVVVRNRLPLGLGLTLPTSRLWGWQVDGVPEADERGYEAPDASRTVTFGRSERRAFEATWDGRIRRGGESDDRIRRGSESDGRIRHSGEPGDRWTPCEGTVSFTGYLAVEGWERRGLYDECRVEVVADR